MHLCLHQACSSTLSLPRRHCRPSSASNKRLAVEGTCTRLRCTAAATSPSSCCAQYQTTHSQQSTLGTASPCCGFCQINSIHIIAERVWPLPGPCRRRLLQSLALLLLPAHSSTAQGAAPSSQLAQPALEQSAHAAPQGVPAALEGQAKQAVEQALRKSVDKAKARH